VPGRSEKTVDAVHPDDTMHPPASSFQALLRSIGAFFDSSGASSISVIETTSGFAARFYPAEEGEDLQSRSFTLEELRAEADAARHRPRSTSSGTGQDRSYENVLRTLGWELDDLAAAAITIDELPSGYYVSWLERNPEEGLVVVKRHATVGVDVLTSMLRDAEGRRRSNVLTAQAPGDEDPVTAP
jgi:hypothetical protein